MEIRGRGIGILRVMQQGILMEEDGVDRSGLRGRLRDWREFRVMVGI